MIKTECVKGVPGMELKVIKEEFSVCKVRDLSKIDFAEEFCFLGKTDQELSLVCRTQAVPEPTVSREDGWKAFRVEGILDFSLIGILAGISALLAEAKIGIFVVSTYNTDYVLTRQPDFERALETLRAGGYTVLL